jgi:hypothetical protein
VTGPKRSPPSLRAGQILFPLVTLMFSIGLVTDPAVLWRAVPLALGNNPTPFIFSGIPGVVAALLMRTG